MTRDKMIEKLMEMASELIKSYDYEKNNKMWELCSDWNTEHEDEEIFMSDVAGDDNVVNGFMIEDYIYYWED